MTRPDRDQPRLLREVRADNPSAMTLEGTRTFMVGQRRVAVIDPGPDDAVHLDAIADRVGDGAVVAILLTHQHPDHAAGADALAVRVDAPVLGIGRETLHHGSAVSTDAGAVVAVHTPGHTPDHVSFHWPSGRAIFCGDLMMGGLDTALVASPEGNLREYLASLEMLRALEPEVIHPAHGPSIQDPGAAIDRCIQHRADRQIQVLNALGPGAATAREITAAVYGDALPTELRGVAESAVMAYLEYLRERGSVVLDHTRWRRVDE